MPEFRQNQATKEWVVLAPERGGRPSDYAGPRKERRDFPDYKQGCPFCPGNESQTPPELWAARTSGGSSFAPAIGEILERQGALEVFLADQKARQQEILELRSMIYEALRPGTAELFDVCVPRGEISGHVEHVHALGERLGVDLPTYGHAADGNVHTNFMRRRLRDGQLG